MENSCLMREVTWSFWSKRNQLETAFPDRQYAIEDGDVTFKYPIFHHCASCGTHIEYNNDQECCRQFESFLIDLEGKYSIIITKGKHSLEIRKDPNAMHPLFFMN